jgi:glutamine amidotransferase
MIALIDYGIGNLRSVEKALQAVGAEVHLTSDPQALLQATKIILPGVGAFGDGMRGLEERRLAQAIQQACQNGACLLGICLGMQLLFESSQEAPGISGLGLLPGQVRRFDQPGLKTPQTGWNQLLPARPGEQPSLLLAGLAPGSYAYFNHAYYCDPDLEEDWLAATVYGRRYASVVGRGRLYGVQFHPEKSQAVGLQILRNFVERC